MLDMYNSILYYYTLLYALLKKSMVKSTKSSLLMNTFQQYTLQCTITNLTAIFIINIIAVIIPKINKKHKHFILFYQQLFHLDVIFSIA